jgi:hypothetical protein
LSGQSLSLLTSGCLQDLPDIVFQRQKQPKPTTCGRVVIDHENLESRIDHELGNLLSSATTQL